MNIHQKGGGLRPVIWAANKASREHNIIFKTHVGSNFRGFQNERAVVKRLFHDTEDINV